MIGRQAFQPFGPDHLTVLGIAGLLAAALIINAPRLRRLSAPSDRLIRQGLAVLIVGNEVLSWGYALWQGAFGLPLQLCDLAVLLTGWALVGSPRLVREVAVLWGLAGSSQAILTPDLTHGFPSYPWLVFFLGHGGVVASALYLLVRGHVSLTRASVWRVWLVSNGYVVMAGLMNGWLGTNYGYLARKPAHPSLLDVLGPWPFYILSVELIALVLFWCGVGLSRWIDTRANRPVTGGS